jgi:hypothetical protein
MYIHTYIFIIVVFLGSGDTYSKFLGVFSGSCCRSSEQGEW